MQLTSPGPEDQTITTDSRVLFGWLWRRYLRQHTPAMSVAVVFMIIEGSMLGALSWLMQPMFDTVFVQGNSDMLVWVSFLVVGIFLVRAISGIVQKVILSRVAQKTSAAIRLDLLGRIMLLDGSFHQSHPPGLLIQRVHADVAAIGNVWRSIITGAGRDLIGLIILMGVAISVDPIWALLAVIGGPLIILPVTAAQRYIRRKARQARDLGAGLSTRLDEVFHGIVQIKLNALEDYQSNQYRKLTNRFVQTQIKTAFGTAALPGMIDVMSGLGFMAVILYGGAEIISGDKTIGQFMTFFSAMGFAFDPLRRLGNISGIWQVAAAAIERIKQLMETPVSIQSPAEPMALPGGTPDIKLEDVHLSYGDAPVLNGVTFEARPGKTTALVGASGAGKSTIFNLLTRLVDPDGGTARIGGVTTTDLALSDLRGVYSVVTQEALLFDETLRENILLGRKDVSDERLQDVLEAAHVADFLPKLSDGLETRVGPRGSALSGGQRQRVVIARALLRDTPVLLLDEATSALDAQSEKVVQQALDRLSSGRTTLVIAHRLSTIIGADKIIVMDRGKVVDEGTHEELLERGGIYADLYRLQFQDGKAVVDVASAEAIEAAPDTSPTQRSSLLGRIRQQLFG
ncbi:MAG: ABC transporter ATP-binding protein [Pseudomonadota bacterium]